MLFIRIKEEETSNSYSQIMEYIVFFIEKVSEMIDVFHEIFKSLLGISAPTVAVVKGAALGGGCEVALFCDLVIASEKAKFGQPEIMVGVFPPVAAAIFPRIIGTKKALELCELGVEVIGGCCGTTPQHTRALLRALRG